MTVCDKTESTPIFLEAFLPHKLAILSRLTQSLLASALAEHDMTIAQWRVYVCLAQQGPSSLNGICEFTRLPQSSLSRSIARMDERGLVRNQREKADRRHAKIEITAKGLKHFEQAGETVNRRCRDALRLDEAEEAQFLATVDGLIERLSLFGPGAE